MPRAKSVPLCALDPSACSPTSEHGQFSSPQAPTPVRCSTSSGGWAGQDAEAWDPRVGPAFPSSYELRTQAGKGLGSPGLHRNAPQGTVPGRGLFP